MRDRKNNILYLYLLIILLTISLTLVNIIYGTESKRRGIISLLVLAIVILDALRSPSWQGVENKKSKREIVTVFFVIMENQLLIPFGFEYEILSPFGLFFIFAHIVFIIAIYYLISEKFLSKALESGGLLWKEEMRNER